MKGDNGYNEQGNELYQSSVNTQPYPRVFNNVKGGTMIIAWGTCKICNVCERAIPLGDGGGGPVVTTD